MVWSENIAPGTPAYEIASSVNQYVRVVAGLGTGKSFAMKRRVARLLESGVNPQSILPVTFTRVAAEDLHRELVGMGVPKCNELKGTTLHGLALRILLRNHVLQTTGRTPCPLNDFERKPLEADLCAHGHLREVRKKIGAYEAAWARLQQDEPGYSQSEEDRNFSQDLESWLRFHKAMLIGEVIPQLYQYLRNNPAAGERREFAHILVDEYQDLNKAEQGVIDLLSDTADVCIVGDDDQSIYSFKYAHPEGIREWSATRLNADDCTLVECRRCPTRITSMANSLISHNVNRPLPKVLIPRNENGSGDIRILQYTNLAQEVEGVVTLITELIGKGTPPGDILVLAQRGVIGTLIYNGLVSQNIPVRSYYAEVELDVEDAQAKYALLKLFIDRTDRVALRWLLGYRSADWLARSYARVRQICEETNSTPWQILSEVADEQRVLSYVAALVERFRDIRRTIEALESFDDLFAVIEHLFPEGQENIQGIRDLALQTLQVIDSQDRTQFMKELATAISKPEIPFEIQDVRIMSLHKSKGLSSPVTIISGCVDGLLPSEPDQNATQTARQAEIEEQRRLFYVGITRVKAIPEKSKPGTLIITYSQYMPVKEALGAGIQPAAQYHGVASLHASRFISELGPEAPTPEKA